MRFRLFSFGIDWPIEVRRVLSARVRAFARPPAKEAKRTRGFTNRTGEHQNLFVIEMGKIAHGQSLEVEEMGDHLRLGGFEAAVQLEFDDDGVAINARAAQP